MLVSVLPIEEAQKASKASKQDAKHGITPSAAQAAAAAAAARAAGTESSLSKEMLRLGESASSQQSIIELSANCLVRHRTRLVPEWDSQVALSRPCMVVKLWKIFAKISFSLSWPWGLH